MTPRELQASILGSDLLPSERLVGLVIAFHLNAKTRQTKLKKSTIANECGLSPRSVRRAVASLVSIGLIEEEMDNGRSSFYRIPSGNNTGTVTRDMGVTGGVTYTTPKKPSRFDLDTEFSTPAEERNKRDQAAFDREQSNSLRF